MENLLETLKQLVDSERRIHAQFLKALGEVIEEKLLLPSGYPTPFVLCTGGWGCPRPALRSGLKWQDWVDGSEVIRRIGNGTLTMTNAYVMSDVMTRENHVELLDKAQGKDKYSVEKLVATLSPEPDIEDFMRRLPETTFSSETASSGSLPLPQPPAGPKEKIKPLSATRTLIRFTGDDELIEMFHTLRDRFRHKYPKGKFEDIAKEAFRLLLVKKDPAREPERKVVARPVKKHTRYVPKRVAREAFRRANSQCTFVARDGTRCSAKSFLQLDHAIPWSLGGSSHDVDNITIRCFHHNQLKGGARSASIPLRGYEGVPYDRASNSSISGRMRFAGIE